MSSLCDALSEDRYGTILAIEVSAGAKSDAFPCGYNEWRKTIGCRVSTPPVEGRANKAVITRIASVIQIPASRVTIFSGSTSSQKKVHIKGMKKEELLAILVPLFGKE